MLRRLLRSGLLLVVVFGTMTTTGTTRRDVALYLPAFAQEFVAVMNGALAARRAAEGRAAVAAEPECGAARTVQRGNIRFQTVRERRC